MIVEGDRETGAWKKREWEVYVRWE